MLRKKLAIAIIVVLTMSSIVGCSNNTVGEESSTVLSTDKEQTEVDDDLEKLEEEQEEEALKEFLGELGIDDEIVEEKTKTDSGANVIGGAKPAKSYPSLGLAQDAFKDYLGLHNQIESLTDEVYQLTGIMIVNTDDFMQAIYSYNSDDEENNKTITVKLSKKLPVEELIEVYFGDENIIHNEEGEMFNVSYKLYKIDSESELYNLAWFTSVDNKSYSIYTKAGLNKSDFENLLDELIWNVTTMDEWRE